LLYSHNPSKTAKNQRFLPLALGTRAGSADKGRLRNRSAVCRRPV
jgi:hypothetical protein